MTADDKRRSQLTDHDHVADLADRMLARRDAEFEFEIEWWALTAEEQDEFMALMRQRTAHGEEVLEAIEGNVRALKALLVLLARGAPAGMGLGQAIEDGYIGLLEVIEAIRSPSAPTSA